MNAEKPTNLLSLLPKGVDDIVSKYVNTIDVGNQLAHGNNYLTIDNGSLHMEICLFEKRVDPKKILQDIDEFVKLRKTKTKCAVQLGTNDVRLNPEGILVREPTLLTLAIQPRYKKYIVSSGCICVDVPFDQENVMDKIISIIRNYYSDK